MKNLLLMLVIFVVYTASMAQVQNPVQWKFEAKKKGANYEIVMAAFVNKPWHIYSQFTDKNGALPTKIVFNNNPLVVLDNVDIKEKGILEKKYDNYLKANVSYYQNEVAFTKLVKVKGGVKTNISGFVQYEVCNYETCLPPTKKAFDIKLL